MKGVSSDRGPARQRGGLLTCFPFARPYSPRRMSALLLSGGRVIDPARSFDAVADVLLRDGKVAAIGTDASAQAGEGAERFDARGKVVCPGLIDLHAHLREPGQS